jgi:glycosyltransferase involved in cell wall biosynthesis
VRYLFLHQNFPGQFKHLAPALAERGHDVAALGLNKTGEPIPGVRHLAYPRETAFPEVPPDSHLLAHVMNEQSWKLLRGKAVGDAMGMLRHIGWTPDIVIAHPSWGEATFVRDVFPKARIVLYTEYFFSANKIEWGFDPKFQEFSEPDLATLMRLRVKNMHLTQALGECDASVTPTEFQKRSHPAWAKSSMHVIHDGIDTERFAPNPDARFRLPDGNELSASDEVVTFVSRQLEPMRGYHVFMRALPKLQKLRPHAHVVIVGGTQQGYGAPPPAGKTWKDVFLDEVRADLDMSRVHFVGTLPHEQLTQLMQVSSAHAYLTYPYVLSWSLMEALSIGCVVIGSDTEPVREVIRHGHNGLLTNFFDAQALAQVAAETLGRRHELAAMRDAARRTIVEHYDLKAKCLPAWLALVEESLQIR